MYTSSAQTLKVWTAALPERGRVALQEGGTRGREGGRPLWFRTDPSARRYEETGAAWGVVEEDNMGLFKTTTNII